MEGNEFIASPPALLAAVLSGSIHMCQSSFAEDIIIKPLERWQIKKENRDESASYHNVHLWKITLSTPYFFSEFLHSFQFLCHFSHILFSFILTSTRFHHITLLRFLSIPRGSYSGTLAASFSLFFFSCLDRWHPIIACPSVFLNLITIHLSLLLSHPNHVSPPLLS